MCIFCYPSYLITMTLKHNICFHKCPFVFYQTSLGSTGAHTTTQQFFLCCFFCGSNTMLVGSFNYGLPDPPNIYHFLNNVTLQRVWVLRELEYGGGWCSTPGKTVKGFGRVATVPNRRAPQTRVKKLFCCCHWFLIIVHLCCYCSTFTLIRLEQGRCQMLKPLQWNGEILQRIHFEHSYQYNL